MPKWLPATLALVFWSSLVLSVLRDWRRCLRDVRRGVMPRELLAPHITIDMLGITAGIAFAVTLHFFLMGTPD